MIGQKNVLIAKEILKIPIPIKAEDTGGPDLPGKLISTPLQPAISVSRAKLSLSPVSTSLFASKY